MYTNRYALPNEFIEEQKRFNINRIALFGRKIEKLDHFFKNVTELLTQMTSPA